MKKIFLLLFTLVSIASADTDYILYARNATEVDAMWNVLNAIAMMFHHDSYIGMLKLIFLFGGFSALYSLVMNAGKGSGMEGLSNFTKYHVGVVAILSIIYSSTSTVLIKTNNLPTYFETTSPSSVGLAVDNVPTIVAFTYVFIDRFGNNLTDMFETAFASTSDYSIKNQGYAAPLRDSITFLSSNFKDSDVIFGNEMENYFSNCIFIPFSAAEDGKVELKNLLESEDIVMTIDSWYGNGTIVNGTAANYFTAEKNSGDIVECDTYWNELKSMKLADYDATVAEIIPNLDKGDLQLITGLRDYPKSNIEQIGIQAALINAIKENKNLGTGIPQSYAEGKTKADFVQSSLASGSYMSSMLPLMQSMLRVLLLAFLPALIAVAILPGGFSVLKNYAKTIVWLELWGALAAVLNYFMLTETQQKIMSSTHGVNFYKSAEIISEAAISAGMAGYLYAMIPAIAWGLMSGSFTMLGGIAGGLGKSLNQNIGNAAMAKDAQSMKMMEKTNKETGANFSLAEAQHYKALNDGTQEGIKLGTDINQSEKGFENKLKYDFNSSYENLKKKQDALGAGNFKKVLETESTAAGLNVAGQSGTNEVVTPKTSKDAGIVKGIGTNVSSSMLDTVGQDALFDSGKFKEMESTLTNLTKNQTLSENGGVENNIVASAAISAKKESTAIKEKMEQTGGSTNEIGKIEGEKEGLDFSKTSGFVGGTTVKQQNETGKHNAAGDNSKAKIISKWGQSKVEDSNFHSENKEKVENLTADNFYNKQPGGQDKYLEQLKKFDVTGTNSKFKGIDANGDNTVSDKEIKKYGNVETKQNQADFITEQHEQKEKEAAAARMKHANDPRLRSGANSGGEFGNNSGSKLAGYGNAMVNAGTTLDPYQKDIDLTTKRNLDNEGVNVSKLAENKTVDVVEKTAHTENRGETEATAFLDEKDRNYKEAYQKNLDEAHEKGLSGTAAINYASKETAKDIKMHDSDNGKRLYSSEVALQKEAINEKKAAITGGDKKVEEYANKAQALNAYKKQANKFPAGSPQRKMLETQASKLENDMNDIKAHAGDKGAFTQKVNALHKLNKQERDVETNVAKKMESEGHLTRTKDGGLHFSDAKEEFENSPHLSRKTAALKGAGDANKLETTGDDGKDIVKTTNSKGELVTNHRASKKGNVEEGDFRSDITYHAKDKLDISDEALQYSTTGLNVVKEVTQFVPAAKVLKLGGKVDDVVDPKEVASAAMRTKITRGY